MKKKILFLIDSLKIGGGIERVISSLAKSLSEKYEIFLLTFKDFKNIYPFRGKYYSLKENLGFYQNFLNFFKIYTAIRPIRIYKLIKSISPDLLISNMYYTDIFIILTKYFFRFKIPLIIAIHTNLKMKFEKKKRYFNFLIKILYSSKIVNKIIVVSKVVQTILEKDYKIKKNKLKIIYNGIDIERIKELKNDKILEYEEIFNNNSIIKFITVGRLIELKGHKYLIEAFSKVIKEIKNSKLFIIGDGPLRNELMVLIKKKTLEKDIILLGLKKNIFKYLAKSDIFVLSSKYEGLPMVLLEALACGLPIISTNCNTGPKEILENGKYGFLVNVMDSEDLAEKMIFLAKNNDYKKKFSKLSLIRSEFFALEKFTNEWINIIEKII